METKALRKFLETNGFEVNSYMAEKYGYMLSKQMGAGVEAVVFLKPFTVDELKKQAIKYNPIEELKTLRRDKIRKTGLPIIETFNQIKAFHNLLKQVAAKV